ncbi:2-hydroxyglutaryl-CoA dehydratase [Loigolactobacillus backii]|uniref:2-hydroxyglutaryl-CoA dehydratase n=1 Tax=Loigolactobacillus backii TaxID=375175 RepID=A0A192H0D4_9LACO|nr:2-hydroxyacyl-CoA dehydratase [Loigolactobacillus backii]ANK62249.1 2-hydroxyglutaryl-CoA dehydratase [Loigolactobacillus backii]ANK70738.1 2-hydroxyglutaryl-CoA dehydratase [Loigolactobacillus backii]
MTKLRGGIDVGSTTVKLVIMNEQNETLFARYERHYSDVKTASKKIIDEAIKELGPTVPISFTITGSGGMGLANLLQLKFIQEVIACTKTVEELIPQTDVSIELGGEDAKITFFGASLEQRMNGSCAGGTGAFIDQMATLLKTDANGLNIMARDYEMIYPIASRCGVFAKTDVQPLINDGAKKADIAASIFQAVVNQTIAGLASGRKIRGKVAFLGGPLYFMDQLRARFIDTLNLAPEDVVFPADPQLFVAKGAAFYAADQPEITLVTLADRLVNGDDSVMKPSRSLAPLFKNDDELQEFRKRHAQAKVEERDLASYHGTAFLGIDAGSTTTKVALMSTDHKLLYTYYDSNDGDPLKKTEEILRDLYAKLPADVVIGKTAVTGYGEHLIKNALMVDIGEVETVAHYRAAHYFQPNVDFILDIGGQDMKAMTVKNDALATIKLNEACSSGCGSFIETFATSLKYSVKNFAQAALLAQHPADLGSRCTVFMNSKVKQVQKEGASIGDISAGLSMSVIKNALYKVIKLRRPEDLGENIVCQGGTFYNEAVLRAFELISGRQVIRPNIAGLMGAYGAALIAEEAYQDGDQTTLLKPEQMDNLTSKKEFMHCGLCENNCALTITIFNDGRRFVTGNRCERGEARGMKQRVPKSNGKINLVQEKYKLLFSYRPLRKKLATRGIIGMPRVLNMYEDYPMWQTFFTKLGIRAELSPKGSKEQYEKGIETIPSDTVCYPAKQVHGHIQALIDKGVKTIFYPGVVYEREENKDAQNHFNCPIVQSYPDVIKNNVDEIREGKVNYLDPYLNLADHESTAKNLCEALSSFDVSLDEVKTALEASYAELEHFKQQVRDRGEDTLRLLKQNGERGIVLAGRPYHLDPEVNHGISQIMTAEGFNVLTEDSIAHLGDVKGLRVVNQWVYHSRLYAAARVAARDPQLELVQLNSFGCGLDAIDTDQIEDIMSQYNRLYTVLKIDEGTNMGAVRIRLRSLKAAVKERNKRLIMPTKQFEDDKPITFTKDMQKEHYTLLMPMMSPIHQNGLVDVALQASGYNVVNLPTDDHHAIDEGQKFVNNDACFPAIISIGQMLEALKSGKYDLDHTAVMMTQTGGGCRATNYIPLIRKALKDAGFAKIPVVSMSLGNQGVEETPGFKLTLPLLKRVALGFLYGDLFERVVYKTRPYEQNPGQVDQMHADWLKLVKPSIVKGSFRQFKKNVRQIVRDFDTVPLTDEIRPKVGLVGEILVKYSPIANNDLVHLLESEGAEAVVPDIVGFMNYSLYNQIYKYKQFGFAKKSEVLAEMGLKLINWCEKPMQAALVASDRFTGIDAIETLANDASKVLSLGNQTGEGWFLTGEMISLLKEDVNNIICMQPFGCLPNHVVGKGVVKELRREYPKANIAPIDYDPGVSIVNQLNRIRLMLATANKALAKDEEVKVH